MRALTILPLLAMFLCAETPNTGVEKDGLHFAVSVSDVSIVAGRPVILGFSWTNTSSKEILIEDWRGPLEGVTGLDHRTSDPLCDVAVYFGRRNLRRGAAGDRPGATLVLTDREK